MMHTTSADQVVLQELGARVAATRLARNQTQAELAAAAGVSKRTIERLEAGYTTQMTALIRILRAFDMLDRLDLLVPQAEVSPMARLESRRPKRQRASGSKGKQASTSRSAWTWGET